MTITTKSMGAEEASHWNRFVDKHPNSCVYHRYEWRNVITVCYGHDTHYLSAQENSDSVTSLAGGKAPVEWNDVNTDNAKDLVGVLPLVHLRHWIFGNELVSMPFFDSGGIIVEHELAEAALLKEGVALAEQLGVGCIELRHQSPLLGFNNQHTEQDCDGEKPILFGAKDWYLSTKTHKVRMLLPLPDSPDRLLKSFKAKLRSQIRKPIKEKLTAKIGGAELVDDFYDVFVTNMRDLGSPVHSKRIFIETLTQFPASSNLVVVYNKEIPVASSMIIGFNDLLANPWSSSLRRYSKLAPNMLLYWSMLEFACQNGYSYFDFGRSTPGESTYKFKEQWGAIPIPLYWYQLSRKPDQNLAGRVEGAKMRKAIAYWKRLPVPVTRLLGPMIRKYISL